MKKKYIPITKSFKEEYEAATRNCLRQLCGGKKLNIRLKRAEGPKSVYDEWVNFDKMTDSDIKESQPPT